MHPSVTREEVIRLAEIMAYKRNACENVCQGGAKAGIAYDYKAPDAYQVLKRFIIGRNLLFRHIWSGRKTV